MSRKLAVAVLICVGGGSLGFFATTSTAQVWVGGGVHVRAPFVRVDVGPYGGVSVRAPFTAIDVPSRAYYYERYYGPPVVFERRIVEPAYPTAAELASMDRAQLGDALLSISRRLHDRLGRFDTGNTWQRYFRLPEDAVDLSTDSNDRTTALTTLLEKFQRIDSNPQYSMIARLPAFTAMVEALNEVVSRSVVGDGPNGSAIEDLPLPQPKRPNDDVRGREISAERVDDGLWTGDARAQKREDRNRPFLTPRPRQ
jgi:hypothetical protein